MDTECALKTQSDRGSHMAELGLSDEAVQAFLWLFDDLIYSYTVKAEGDTVVFELDESYAYKRNLILHNCALLDTEDYQTLDFCESEIIKNGDRYEFTAIAEDYETDKGKEIIISFDNAEVHVDLYRADARPFFFSPWDTVSLIASDIAEKERLGEKYFNSRELEAFSLIKEMSFLFNESENSFPILKECAHKYGLNKVYNAIEKAEKNRNFSKLKNILNESYCEELWREIYQKLVWTQEGYGLKKPNQSEEVLTEKRKAIEEYFIGEGFNGKYPDFYKNGDMKSLHLEESYGLSYFIGMEQNVRFYIRCIEDIFGGQLTVNFLCGTALIKENEETDVYSCCFNKNGRRIFKTVHCDEIDKLLDYACIAAKKAQCKRLNKQEKKLYYGEAFSLKTFLLMFIVMGGLFAVMMTVAMLLLCCGLTAVISGFKEIPQMLTEMPWGLVFIISFVGFGGAMAVIDILAQRK